MKKIKSLTDAQRNQFKPWVKKWIGIGMNTKEANWEIAEENIRKCYQFANLNPNIPIIRVQSPIAGALAVPIIANILVGDSEILSEVDIAVDSEVRSAVDSSVNSSVHSEVLAKIKNGKIFWHYWIGGRFWISYQSYLSFLMDVCGLELSKDITERYLAYRNVQTSIGYWWPNKNFVIVSNSPEFIKTNPQGKLHSENSMAIKYRDGWGLYMLNGIKVPKYLVMTDSDKLDIGFFIKEKNADVRAEFIRKYGIERMVSLGKSIQKLTDYTDDWFNQSEYELINMGGIYGINYAPHLKMKNLTTGIYHLEGVHPDCKTIEHALNWRAKGKKIKIGCIK